MSKPTQKTSRSRTGNRRSHHALKKVQLVRDEEGNLHLPHHATPATGTYKGKKIVDVAKRALRRARHTKPLN